MAGLRFPLPARDRVLLHLSEHQNLRADEPQYPTAVTQDGIAWRTDLGRAHVALALKALREEGLVEELKGRVAGEARRRKVYLLAEGGLRSAQGLLSVLMEERVLVRGLGTDERIPLAEVSFRMKKKVPLVELALSIAQGAVLEFGEDGLPRGPEAREAAPDAGAPPAPAPEAPALPPQGGPPGFPPPPPEGPAAAAPPPMVPMFTVQAPPRDWDRWGRLAAVAAASLFLAGVLIFLARELGQELSFEFLFLYFAVMATLQWVILGFWGIPAGVRSELGLYIGCLLAIQGGVLVFHPLFISLLWLLEGLLLVSTSVLLHPLPPDRPAQTAGASAGTFILWASFQGGLYFSERWPPGIALALLWALVGCLLVIARVYPDHALYVSRLKTAAVLSTGMLMLAIGLFLALRGFPAEGFVEVVVAAAIFYHSAPLKREQWDWMLTCFTLILCTVVAVSTYLFLDAVLGDPARFLG